MEYARAASNNFSNAANVYTRKTNFSDIAHNVNFSFCWLVCVCFFFKSLKSHDSSAVLYYIFFSYFLRVHIYMCYIYLFGKLVLCVLHGWWCVIVFWSFIFGIIIFFFLFSWKCLFLRSYIDYNFMLLELYVIYRWEENEYN